MRQPHSPASPTRAPVCPPIRWWTAWRCTLAGRRDAPGAEPAAETGHLPFTQNLHAQAQRGEAETSRWLHQQVLPIDQQIVGLCSRISHHHQPSAAPTPPPASPGSFEQTRAAREARRLHSDRLQRHADLGRDGEQLAGLLAVRRHTIEQARDIIAVFAARYDRLVACHRRGLLRHRSDDALTASMWPVPPFTATLPWVAGDLPLLATSIDPATREVVEWAMREFDTTGDRARLHAV